MNKKTGPARARILSALPALALTGALLALTPTAQASLVLQNLGDEVLDTTTGLIWMQDWNLSGTANWTNQTQWAANLSYAGQTTWRLPSITEGLDLVGAYGDPRLITEFTNVAASGDHWWTSSQRGSQAWIFYAGGGQLFTTTSSPQRGVAVRSATLADVAFGVPEPTSMALALLALGAGSLVRKRTGKVLRA